MTGTYKMKIYEILKSIMTLNIVCRKWHRAVMSHNISLIVLVLVLENEEPVPLSQNVGVTPNLIQWPKAYFKAEI